MIQQSRGQEKCRSHAGFSNVLGKIQNTVHGDLGENPAPKGEMIQILILIQSWSGFPRTLLQLDDTACGIETLHRYLYWYFYNFQLQLDDTACGIETTSYVYARPCSDSQLQLDDTACGIETPY